MGQWVLIMRSRHLFLKSKVDRHNRWLMIAMCLALGAAVLVLLPRQQKIDDGVWQNPIEPPGVTIVSHEPQPLLTPPEKPAAIEAAQPQQGAAEVPAGTEIAISTAPTQAAVVANDHAQIRKTIELWSAAWSARNLESYFAQYAQSFVPAGGQSRSAWEKARRQRILSKIQITHEVRELQITLDENQATANFEQMYATDQTRQVGPKTLKLKKDGTHWRIISESSN